MHGPDRCRAPFRPSRAVGPLELSRYSQRLVSARCPILPNSHHNSALNRLFTIGRQRNRQHALGWRNAEERSHRFARISCRRGRRSEFRRGSASASARRDDVASWSVHDNRLSELRRLRHYLSRAGQPWPRGGYQGMLPQRNGLSVRQADGCAHTQVQGRAVRHRPALRQGSPPFGFGAARQCCSCPPDFRRKRHRLYGDGPHRRAGPSGHRIFNLPLHRP